MFPGPTWLSIPKCISISSAVFPQSIYTVHPHIAVFHSPGNISHRKMQGTDKYNKHTKGIWQHKVLICRTIICHFTATLTTTAGSLHAALADSCRHPSRVTGHHVVQCSSAYNSHIYKMFTYFEEAYNSLLQHPWVHQFASWPIHELAIQDSAYPHAVQLTTTIFYRLHMAKRRIPDIQLHSLHTGKSCPNPINKTKPNPNSWLVAWSLTCLFSKNTAISETTKV